MARKVRKRMHRKLPPTERQEVDRLAELVESRSEQAEARRFFAEHPRLRELIIMLNAERERQGLSLGQMAERTDIDPANLHRLENNPNANPTLATGQRLAHALGK